MYFLIGEREKTQKMEGREGRGDRGLSFSREEKQSTKV